MTKQEAAEMNNKIGAMMPDLIGVSGEGSLLDMILTKPDEINAWHKLMDPEMPRVCPECLRIIDSPDSVLPRVELPVDPDKVPLAFVECQAVCPYCQKIIHREFSEYAYPFESAVFVQKAILKNLKEKAGEQRA